MQAHPLRVQPCGNRLLGGGAACCRAEGLGLLACLPDELLLALLELLEPRWLAVLGCCSRACYAFAAHEELWRAAALGAFGGDLLFRRSWRETYSRRLRGRDAPEQPPSAPARVDASGVYSDLLFAAHRCASTPLRPEWLSRDNVPREANLSLADFVARYETPNLPVLLTDVVPTWPAWGVWSAAHLREAHGGERVHAGGYAFALRDYLSYAEAVKADDSPLYLFDREVLQRTSLCEEYAPPPYFTADRDHFSLLGAERPDHAWLIAGPPRSGSSFHKDPNATSAWNGVLCGSKKWVLFPPSVTPPGVAASADGAHVSTPTSLVDWFLNFHGNWGACGAPLECVCAAGELLFVPSGWWHLAMNLEEVPVTLAVTHNLVSDANLHKVLAHLASCSPDLVSGCAPQQRAQLHGRFLAALRENKPQTLDRALELLRAKSTYAEDEQARAFTFSFGA